VIDHQCHNDQGILRDEIDLALSADKKLRFGIRLVHHKFASSECSGIELCRMSPNEFPDTATEYDILHLLSRKGGDHIYELHFKDITVTYMIRNQSSSV
jgi:hypothetical protein